jgi:hypothetical protein
VILILIIILILVLNTKTNTNTKGKKAKKWVKRLNELNINTDDDMFEKWPSVIIKKIRIKYYDNDYNTNVEICYIHTYKDDNDHDTSRHQWISLSIEHDHIDNITR